MTLYDRDRGHGRSFKLMTVHEHSFLFDDFPPKDMSRSVTFDFGDFLISFSWYLIVNDRLMDIHERPMDSHDHFMDVHWLHKIIMIRSPISVIFFCKL